MRKKKRITIFDACNTLFMLLVLFVTLYPLYFTIIASFSSGHAIAGGKVIWRPVDFSLDAYKHVFAYKQIWVGYANTIFYTVFGTMFNLILTIPAAYALSKKNMPHRNLIMTIFLITMYFGGGMVPTYVQIQRMGLLNTRMVLVIVAGVSVYNLIVTRVFFSTSIPDSLYEAAEIDGAGELKKFFFIGLPLAKAILAVMTLYYAVAHWNQYFSAMLYLSDSKLEPLQSVLRRVLIQNENALSAQVLEESNSMEFVLESAKRAEAAYTMKYAMVFIASAPLLIAYPFVQKHFVKGVMIGAVKE